MTIPNHEGAQPDTLRDALVGKAIRDYAYEMQWQLYAGDEVPLAKRILAALDSAQLVGQQQQPSETLSWGDARSALRAELLAAGLDGIRADRLARDAAARFKTALGAESPHQRTQPASESSE